MRVASLATGLSRDLRRVDWRGERVGILWIR